MQQTKTAINVLFVLDFVLNKLQIIQNKNRFKTMFKLFSGKHLNRINMLYKVH